MMQILSINNYKMVIKYISGNNDFDAEIISHLQSIKSLLLRLDKWPRLSFLPADK